MTDTLDIHVPPKLRVTDDWIEHGTLGRFRRTGQVRIPLAGEYYLTTECIGIGLAMQDRNRPHEILEKAHD